MILRLLVVCAALVFAQGEEEQPVADQDMTRQVAERIKSDPNVAHSLAERIAYTKFAKTMGTREEIDRWVRENPDSAAAIAIGLAKDDASGTHEFEEQLHERTREKFETNEGSKKNLYNRLSRAAKNSRLMNKDAAMQDEERSEIIKQIFEGKSGSTSKILNVQDNGPTKDSGFHGPGVQAGFFDRLGQGNLRGYSPQLQAMQSSLNQRRVPGAPKLIETGRLDYETLSYPGHAMRYDVSNLERKMRLDRNWQLARALGRDVRGLTEQQLLDPAFEAELLKQAAAQGKGPSPRSLRRQAALERAAAAMRQFEQAALAAKDPNHISKALLAELGSKQREAARWITVAALEEELERLEADETFLSADLLGMIDRCPVGPAEKASYRRRGEGYSENLKRVKASAEQAVIVLSSDGWSSQVDLVQRTLDENSQARRVLSRNIADYRAVPYHLLALDEPKPKWRETLDEYAKRWAPNLAYSRRLLAIDASKEKLKDVFVRIASGDLDAAHTILAAYQPQGGPPSRR